MARAHGPVAHMTLAVLVVITTGCSTGGATADAPPSPGPGSAPPSAPASPTPTPASTATDPELRAELLAMLAADQADRVDEEGGDIGSDRARTDRLRQIIAERGWPGSTSVGADGATAAWAIAQHSDLDPQFQQQALELMRGAVAAREADPGELAYLVDRVAANAGRPQTYGTQMGCTDDGRPQPAPLADPDRVDALRAAAGLPPLADYLAEMAEVCAGS